MNIRQPQVSNYLTTDTGGSFLEQEVVMPFDLAAGLIVALVSCVGGLVWLIREAKGRKRCERMEAYLRLERKAGTDRGRRSTKQVMTALGITSGQVMDAARRSRAIKRLAIVENMNSAETAVFECAPPTDVREPPMMAFALPVRRRSGAERQGVGKSADQHRYRVPHGSSSVPTRPPIICHVTITVGRRGNDEPC